ncbi:MAG: YcxB family protein [Lachnospiraceae bacterium]|nr:YcxB family protein [Lachnospiraceae bacterium]
MPITFQAKIDERDLFRFNMRHTYTSFVGIVSIVAAILIFAIAIAMHERLGTENVVLYCVVGALFLIYTPISLKMRTKAVMAMDSPLAHPITYTLQEDGIAIKTEVTATTTDTDAFLPYDLVYRVLLTRDYLLIYSGRKNAYIIPRHCVDGNLEEILSVFRSKLKPYQLSI